MTAVEFAEIDRYVAVDVETTGVYNSDRVVEIAAVTVNSDGEIIDEWDTLVDPQRDVGPTWLHGVSASMVSNAPTFDEVGSALASRLVGAVVVAHNLTFDTRFLTNEYQRADVSPDFGRGVDTMRICGGKLETVCDRFGVKLKEAHRAVGDARATAEVLSRLLDQIDSAQLRPAAVEHGLPTKPRTHRREATRPPSGESLRPPYLGYLAAHLHHLDAETRLLPYLDLLDWALADLVIEEGERNQLVWLAGSLGLSEEDRERAHLGYMNELVVAAMRDGMLTENEHEQLEKAATALDLDWPSFQAVLEPHRWTPSPAPLESVSTVCFTGDIPKSVQERGFQSRAEVEVFARTLGFETVNNVTKKGCSLLVAGDPSSQSGKAKNARKWGIPIVGIVEFLDEIGTGSE